MSTKCRRLVPRRRTEIAIAILVAMAAFCLRWPLVSWDLNVADEGYLATAAQRILDGEVPYRDFQRNYAPGIFYLLTACLKIFGHSVLVMRYLWLVMLAAVCALAYLVARPFAPRWAAGWAALVPAFLQPPVHKMFVPLSVVAALLIARHTLRQNLSRGGIFILGICLGTVALFRQDAAGAGFLTASITFVGEAFLQVRGSGASKITAAARAFLNVTLFSAGVITVCLPVGAAFAAAGALCAMIKQLLLDGLRDNAAMALPFPPLSVVVSRGTALFGRVEAAAFYYPALASCSGLLLALSARFSRRFRRRHLFIMQIAAMTILMHAAFLQRSDLPHLKQVLVLPSLLAALIAGEMWRWIVRRKAAPARRVIGAAVLAAALGSAVLFTWWGLSADLLDAYRDRSRGQPLGEPRARVYLPRRKRDRIRFAIDAIRENSQPGEPILVAPYAPLLYFITGRPNATEHDSMFPGMVSAPGVQKSILRDLRRAGVRLIVVWGIEWDDRPERRFPEYADELAAFMEREFTLVDSYGKWYIYKRRGDAPNDR